MRALHIVLNNFKYDSRVQKECNSIFITLGMDVQVFALHEEPLLAHEKSDFGDVRRFRLQTRSWPRIKIFQAIKYLECIIRMLYSARLYKPNIIHVHDLDSLPIGVIISKAIGIPLIYDAHEYETAIEGLVQGSVEHRIKLFVERICLKYAGSVITVSPSIAKEYSRLYGIEMPDVVLNCPPKVEQQVKNSKLKEIFNISEENTVFLYQGRLAPAYGTRMLLKLFSELTEYPIDIVFIGYGPDYDLIKSYSLEYTHIHLKDAVPYNELPYWTRGADVGICPIENSCLSYYYCLPNKLFEYVSVGLPVIVSDLFEMGIIVDSNKVGWTYHDEKDLKEIVRTLIGISLDSFRASAIELSKRYCWEQQEQTLLNVYRRLLNLNNDKPSNTRMLKQQETGS